MKQRIALFAVAALAIGAIAVSQRQKIAVDASSEPIFHLVADTQQELTRIPMSLTRISDQEEIAIGTRIASGYLSVWQINPRDPAQTSAQAYVQQVGGRVAQNAQRRLPYAFHYIADPRMVNAFALPGGHVFIGQGLIELMDSEDELAAVLGHEVEHVDLRHCAERVQVQARLRRLPLGDLAAAVTSISYEVFAAGYNKEQEQAADANGTELSVAAGYSPLGGVRMFQTLARLEPQAMRAQTPQEEMSRVAAGTLQEYFRTHPPSAERAQRIQELMTARGWPAKGERNLAITYIALTAKAREALWAFDYAPAVALATRSLSVVPNQASAEEVLYTANMYLGRFDAAADAARTLIGLEPQTSNHLQQFADALAAESHARSSEAFGAAMQGSRSVYEQFMMEIDEAGLRMLSGDQRPMQAVLGRVPVGGAGDALLRSSISAREMATALTRIGVWFYRAGQFDEATKLLDRAEEFAPGLTPTCIYRGFAALQDEHYATATTVLGNCMGVPESQAGRAIVQWRTDQKDVAVHTAGQIIADSRWKNRRWVAATFGEPAYATLTQVFDEVERRKRASRH